MLTSSMEGNAYLWFITQASQLTRFNHVRHGIQYVDLERYFVQMYFWLSHDSVFARRPDNDYIAVRAISQHRQSTAPPEAARVSKGTRLVIAQ